MFALYSNFLFNFYIVELHAVAEDDEMLTSLNEAKSSQRMQHGVCRPAKWGFNGILMLAPSH